MRSKAAPLQAVGDHKSRGPFRIEDEDDDEDSLSDVAFQNVGLQFCRLAKSEVRSA